VATRSQAVAGQPLRAVIFDCDGVLFDSWRANVDFYNAVLEILGRPPLDAEGERHAHVLSSPQLFAILFGDDVALVERATALARDVDFGPFYHRMRPASGLHALLADLKMRYRLAMATNRGVTASRVVAHFGLGDLLELTVGIHDVARPKPSPDMIDKCVAHFGIAAHEAVYVGDTLSDREAARAAGTHFVAVGEHVDAPLWIQELRDLPPLLAATWGVGT
jgi:phosphoglycolate phosphatase-like HAD superfamily hydrolase